GVVDVLLDARRLGVVHALLLGLGLLLGLQQFIVNGASVGVIVPVPDHSTISVLDEEKCNVLSAVGERRHLARLIPVRSGALSIDLALDMLPDELLPKKLFGFGARRLLLRVSRRLLSAASYG